MTLVPSSSVSKLLEDLDNATIAMLNSSGSPYKVKLAFEAVIKHPSSNWTEQTLNYRQRKLFYK